MIRTFFTFCLALLVALVGNTMAQDLRLTVDRSTGAVGVENLGTNVVSVKGYTIGSEGQHLSPDDWMSLADAGLSGWLEANPSTSYLSELNRDSEIAFNSGDLVSLGSAYVTGPQIGDVFFEYITSDLYVLDGLVHYTGPANDLAIYIDPLSGEASMANLSPFIDAPTIKGYSILSDSSGLADSSWTSFASTGLGGEGWVEANPAANHLSELNRDNSTAFETNTVIPLGKIIDPGSDTRDLVFEYFTIEGNVLTGSVEYIPLPGGGGLDLDLDDDGDVDLDDMDLAGPAGIETQDAILDFVNTIRGDVDFVEDADGNKSVQFGDFAALAETFGQAGTKYSQGNLDFSEDGTQFSDFAALAAVFGTVVPANGGAVAAAVPEPSSLMLLGLGGMLFGLTRRRR